MGSNRYRHNIERNSLIIHPSSHNKQTHSPTHTHTCSHLPWTQRAPSSRPFILDCKRHVTDPIASPSHVLREVSYTVELQINGRSTILLWITVLWITEMQIWIIIVTVFIHLYATPSQFAKYCFCPCTAGGPHKGLTNIFP